MGAHLSRRRFDPKHELGPVVTAYGEVGAGRGTQPRAEDAAALAGDGTRVVAAHLDEGHGAPRNVDLGAAGEAGDEPAVVEGRLASRPGRHQQMALAIE